jgi:hypothetical protein
MRHVSIQHSPPPDTPKGLGRGYFLSGEPATKRAVAFFDGQNLFHAAKAAFGHTFRERAHDLDVDLDRARAAQNRRQHGHAVLGEGVRQVLDVSAARQVPVAQGFLRIFGRFRVQGHNL